MTTRESEQQLLRRIVEKLNSNVNLFINSGETKVQGLGFVVSREVRTKNYWHLAYSYQKP